MQWRYVFVFLFFVVSFFAIEIKLFEWQIVKAEELSLLGQQQSSSQLQIIPKRGDIVTSDGFPLVTNKLSYLVFANPKEVAQKDQVAQLLAPILTEDSASISAKLSLDKMWVPLQSNVSNATKEQIDKLNLPGVGFEYSPVRFYPEASLAAQLVGFVGKDAQGNDKGYFGLEGFYDKQLAGRIGIGTEVHDAFGRPVLAELNDNSGEQDGRTLQLHIDRVIQFLLEEKLRKGINDYGAVSGMAAVMDPKTGAILAMAAFPSFDPRSFWEYDTSNYRNPFITDTYEPGSTFKPFVMSTALDAGLIKPTSTCPICDKPVQVGNYAIHTWNNEYFPNTNMIDIMKHSDNTGMVYISTLLGHGKELGLLKAFGFGQTTGIDLQGELAPELKSDNEWYPIDYATAAFGQGISVTPIELLDAFSAIANDGKRMEPHVVASITTSDGQNIPIPPKVLDQPISSNAAKVMTEILVTTVNEGEAKWARLKGYRIAGKTGTASIPVAGHYDPTKTIASFIGYAPAEDPKFSMLVILNQPTKSIYGAETAAPIWFDIAHDILLHDGIDPTEGD